MKCLLLAIAYGILDDGVKNTRFSIESRVLVLGASGDLRCE